MQFFFEKKAEKTLPVGEKYLFLHTFSETERRLKRIKIVLSHHAGITQLVE